MLVSFAEIDGSDPINIRVSIDYSNNRVFFPEQQELANVDWGELEQEILAHVRPNRVDGPTVPSELLSRITKMRSGKYDGHSKYGTEEQ